ncbi:MAG: FkbM family methyltransferase [Pleurocapsa minor HA4230-MV1]|jgi:FkbM family methyltransferase|nr:FkbM family methyltransferase [Pleurocapsa minor HA4230-MV1]
MKLIKDITQSLLWKNGYNLQRIRDFPEKNIDLLKLLVRQLFQNTPEAVILQIGANDGKTGDPVHSIITQDNWSGILVEPLPNLYNELCHTYSHLSKFKLENCAIAKEDGMVKLYRVRADESLPEYVKLLASFNRDVILKQKPLIPNIEQFIEVVEVPGISLTSLIKKHCIQHVNLLQIDTEGFDYEILQMAFQSNLLPDIINFEYTHLLPEVTRECGNLLALKGYSYLKVGRDIVAVQQSLID